MVKLLVIFFVNIFNGTENIVKATKNLVAFICLTIYPLLGLDKLFNIILVKDTLFNKLFTIYPRINIIYIIYYIFKNRLRIRV